MLEMLAVSVSSISRSDGSTWNRRLQDRLRVRQQNHHSWPDPRTTYQSIDDWPLFPFGPFQQSQSRHWYLVGVLSSTSCISITFITIVIPPRMVLIHLSWSISWWCSLPSSMVRTKALISIYFCRTLFWGRSGRNKTLRAMVNCWEFQ